MTESVELVTIEKYKYDDLKKKEKALEIIKSQLVIEKETNIYNRLITLQSYMALTPEEYELLKEVLL